MRILHGARLRRLVFFVGLALLLALIVLGICDKLIRDGADTYLHEEIATLPVNEAGLVLGTSHRTRSGGGNPYFNHRIATAASLWHAGKVRYLLVSGDNGTLSYNEPREMRRALMKAGVDSTRIVLDHAGFRTLDSVVRAKEVFGQQRFTVISQRFHNERAVYLARRLGIEAVGYNAPDPPGWLGPRVWLRERLARVKVFLDLALGTPPRFLGEPIPLESPVEVETTLDSAQQSAVSRPPSP